MKQLEYVKVRPAFQHFETAMPLWPCLTRSLSNVSKSIVGFRF